VSIYSKEESYPYIEICIGMDSELLEVLLVVEVAGVALGDGPAYHLLHLGHLHRQGASMAIATIAMRSLPIAMRGLPIAMRGTFPIPIATKMHLGQRLFDRLVNFSDLPLLDREGVVVDVVQRLFDRLMNFSDLPLDREDIAVGLLVRQVPGHGRGGAAEEDQGGGHVEFHNGLVVAGRENVEGEMMHSLREQRLFKGSRVHNDLREVEVV